MSNDKTIDFSVNVLEDDYYSHRITLFCVIALQRSRIHPASHKRDIKERYTFPLYGISYLSKANTHNSTERQSKTFLLLVSSWNVANEQRKESNGNNAYKEQCMLFSKLSSKC